MQFAVRFGICFGVRVGVCFEILLGSLGVVLVGILEVTRPVKIDAFMDCFFHFLYFWVKIHSKMI